MKRFEEHNDTFADILNGLVFNGEQIIHEEDLEEHEFAEDFYDECAAVEIFSGDIKNVALDEFQDHLRESINR